MAKSEDAAMYWQEHFPFYPRQDRPFPHAEPSQLPPGNDAVLSFGKLTNRRGRHTANCNALDPGWGYKTFHWGSAGGHVPTLAGDDTRVVR